MKNYILLFSFFFFLSCGSNPVTTTTSDSILILILDGQFIPSEITASAGQTIFFDNRDLTHHQILSQSASDSFDNTGDFSSNVIDIDQVGLIIIPETAVSGDQFFFYSGDRQASMITPNGTITIQ